MSAFRYQGLQGGSPVSGVIEASDRREALRRLGEKGVFPSNLEPVSAGIGRTAAAPSSSARTADRAPSTSPPAASAAASSSPAGGGFRLGSGIRRKEITAFTRELAALLAAAIPIPQALAGIAEEESNPALKEIIEKVSLEVKGGVALSSALAAHPRLFPPLYTSMIRVGEEAGALPRVITDLADLLENNVVDILL